MLPVVNPDHLKNQVEGAVVQGLGGALFEQIEFENGKITNAALSAYHVPRFHDTPVLETVLLDRKDLPSEGAGETPIIAIAPPSARPSTMPLAFVCDRFRWRGTVWGRRPRNTASHT